jgi:hypothetical protein
MAGVSFEERLVEKDTTRIARDTSIIRWEVDRTLKTSSLLGRNERKPEAYVVPVRRGLE